VRHGALILVVLCGAMALLATDSTIVTVANPSIQRAFHVNAATLQWTVTAYGLTFGGFLLLGGKLGDVFGRRRVFVVSICVFIAASMLAGTSRSMPELVVFRALQGLGAAAVSPATLSLISECFTEERAHRRALSAWATAGSLGGLIGFVLGGFVTSALGWRWIFYLNGPAGGVCLFGGLAWLPRLRSRSRSRHLDVPGAILVTVGLSLLVLALGESQSAGWAAASTCAAFAGAAACLAGFLIAESRVADPLLPLAMVWRPEGLANAEIALQMAAAIAAQFLASIYMQQVFGYSAFRAGLATLPLPLGFALGTTLSSRLQHRFGPRTLVTVGCLMLTAAQVRLAFLPDHGSYVTTMLPAIAVQAIGLGIGRVPTVIVATSGFAEEQKGIGAGLYNMFLIVGSSIGVALVATVATMAGRTGGAAHGLRSGFVVAVVLAALAAAVAAFGFPRTEPALGRNSAPGSELGGSIDALGGVAPSAAQTSLPAPSQ
jgi:EmrB/QacA subfamily drug resistance transporter